MESAETWKHSNPRLRMADQLVKNKTLIGLSKSEVLNLLGDPGSHGYFKKFDLVYWLGPERSFISIDSEWLAILIDENDITTDAIIVND